MLRGADGSIEWTTPVPWSPDGASVIGGRALTIARSFDQYPPSVTATDVSTGRALWQKFIKSTTLRPAGHTADLIAVQSDDVLYGVKVSDGAVAWQVPLSASLMASGPHTSVFKTTSDALLVDLASGVTREIGPADLAAVTDQGVYVIANGTLSALSLTGSIVFAAQPLPVDATFSDPKLLFVEGDTVVVAISSKLGPDNRVLAIDSASGATRWTVDGARTVTATSNVVLLDRRFGDQPDGITRQLIARDLHTGDELWVRPSMGPLGGFLTTDERANGLFGRPSEPGTDVRLERLSLLTGSGSLPAGEPVIGSSAAGVPVSGGTRGTAKVALTDRVIAVSIGDTKLRAFDASDLASQWTVDLGMPAASVTSASADVLIDVSAPEVFCD